MHFFAVGTPVIAEEPGIWFVAMLGISIVLLGLACLIGLCTLMSALCRVLTKEKNAKPKETLASVEQPSVSTPIPNREEILAAVTAVIAEELGTDVSAIRVHSFRSLEASALPSVPNKGELVAAITTAVAEELGTDVSAVRVHSLRQIS